MSNDVAGGLRNVLPGNIDSLWGPYSDLATANSTIPNNIVEGKSYREGKFVAIGTLSNYKIFWWKGGYDNTNLVEYFGDSEQINKASFLANTIFDQDLIRVVDKVTFDDTLGPVGGNFFGVGFPIGVVQYFDKSSVYLYRNTSFNPSPTKFKCIIKTVNKDGGVLGEVEIIKGIPLAKNFIEFKFPSIIENPTGSELWMEIFSDGVFGHYKRSPAATSIFTVANGYPVRSSNTVNTAYTTKLLPTASIEEDVWTKFSQYDQNIVITNEGVSLINETTPAQITNSLFTQDLGKTDDKLLFEDGIGPQGGGFFAIGFPIGIVQNFDSLTVKGYHSSGTMPTKIKAIVKEVNVDGDEVARKQINIVSIENGANLTIKFDEIIENKLGVRLWVELFADGGFGIYRRFPNASVLFPLTDGYPPYSSANVSTAFDTETFTNTSTVSFDFWASFSQYSLKVDLTEQGKTLLGGTTGSNSEVKQIPSKNYKFSFAGSSVTWGEGYLQSWFVRECIRLLQSKVATAIMPASVLVSNQSGLTNLNSRKLFQSSGIKVEGIGAQIDFKLFGNELSLSQQIERSNVNASVIEVFADEIKIGEFNNFNNSPIGSTTSNFVGNGTDVKFDLARPFTYNHVLTVNGVSKVVQMNTQGASYSFPVGVDAAIIRKYSEGTAGKPFVSHWLYFKVAPLNGDTIVLSYDYGEEISYEKTTIGKTGSGALESAYGDGNISFDTTAPASVSSGLDFRQTDERSVIQYRFADEKERNITLKIKGNYGSATGTPYLSFNFATNRFFHFQNAGIGGYSIFELAKNIDQEYNKSWQRVVEFKPDILIIDVAPNEDWTVKGQKLYTKHAGTSLVDFRKTVVFPLRSITYQSGTDTYDWEQFEGVVTAITETTVTILRDVNHLLESDPVKGDVLMIGSYFSDNKEYVERVIDSYNSSTGVITFLNPISKSEYIYNDLQDFVGKGVRVRDLSYFTNALVGLMDKIKSVSPEVKCAIMPNPLPNLSTRELWGYELLLHNFAKASGYETLSGSSVETFQKSQYRDIEFVIPATSLLIDGITGFKYATLPTTNGRHTIFPEILANGINVHGKDAYLENGMAYRPDPAKSGIQLNKAAGAFSTNTNLSFTATPPRLIFTQNEPVSGDIIIKFSSSQWSGDSTHMNAKSEMLYGDKYVNDFILRNL